MKTLYSFLFALCGLWQVFAQQDSITQLQPVLLSDAKLQDYSTGQAVQTLNDSILSRQAPSLTETLNFTTPIYFKENGLGMVSSPSFRGTTAQQTAVLWNGINVNSMFNGQTDFNTVNVGAYNQINVRPGGGSILYGTGAIGGTVHLDNTLFYQGEEQHHLQASYGSFNTLDARYRYEQSSEKWSVQLSLTRNHSDNDYEYPKQNQQNINGEFFNNSLNAAIGYRFNEGNELRYFGQVYESERHFSVIRPSDNKTRYDDRQYRNLLEWEHRLGKFSGLAKYAYLEERYRYYANISRDDFTFGTAQTQVAKYEASYQFLKTLAASAIVSHNHTQAKGSSITQTSRDISAVSLLMKHQVLPSFQYEVSLRKEATQAYESPWLYGLGLHYEINKYIGLKANISKNFRIPTFNDLYWANAGNPDLTAEQAYQYETGVQLNWKTLRFSLTGYYNALTQMIQWVPNAIGIWQPRNVNDVHTYGLESRIEWEKTFGKHQLALKGSYAYTVSENQETHKQLIYVPYHKATASVYYAYADFFVEYQQLWNGAVFTRSDNNPDFNLSGYSLANLSVGYRLTKNISLGARARNLWNVAYQNVENRPMPGRNYMIYLTLNF